MASRKQHIAGATVLWLIGFLVYYFVGGLYIEISLQKNAMWIMMSFLLAQLGGQMSDYDVIWRKAFPHRNILTHSFFIPLLVCLPIIWITAETTNLLPLFSFFLLGFSSHMFLDLWITKGWSGTALIRFFYWKEEKYKSMNKFWSKVWLFVNGLIILIAGIVMMFTYQLWSM